MVFMPQFISNFDRFIKMRTFLLFNGTEILAKYAMFYYLKVVKNF